jgi:pimeloyl-ACP methyl ester carboxylesterase
VDEQEVSDFRARFQLPGFASWTPEIKELSLSYRGSNPDGVQKWLTIEEHAQQKGAAPQPLRSPNNYAKLETITTPTLVMPADADFYAPPGLMKLLAAHLKDSRWALVPDAGHSVAWEQPDIFNKNVLDFITNY